MTHTSSAKATSQATDKIRIMRSEILSGYNTGGLLGMVRAWIQTTIRFWKEDFSR